MADEDMPIIWLINSAIEFLKRPIEYSVYEFSLWDVTVLTIIAGGIFYIIKESFFND